MDFQLTEDQRAFADMAQSLFADYCTDDKLREHELFGNVTGHETLTPESALALARWIIGGAK